MRIRIDQPNHFLLAVGVLLSVTLRVLAYMAIPGQPAFSFGGATGVLLARYFAGTLSVLGALAILIYAAQWGVLAFKFAKGKVTLREC